MHALRYYINEGRSPTATVVQAADLFAAMIA